RGGRTRRRGHGQAGRAHLGCGGRAGGAAAGGAPPRRPRARGEPRRGGAGGAAALRGGRGEGGTERREGRPRVTMHAPERARSHTYVRSDHPGVEALTNTLESGTLRNTTGRRRRGAAPKEIEPVSTERDRALSTALGQIERSYGKGAIMRLGAAEAQRNVEAIPTGALTLD